MNTTDERNDIAAPASPPASPLAKGGHVVSWGCIVVALIFLANPMPLLVDILPDAIGFALILFALRRAVGEINAFNDLRRPTQTLLFISLSKIPALVIMLSIWGGNSGERAILAVFTLVYSIMEFIYLRTWTHEFFDAMARYGQAYHCEAALSTTGHSYRISPETLERLTLIFVFVRSLLSCLPEIALVPLTEIDLSGTKIIKWNALYPILLILACFVLLIFGIIWACYIVAYVKRIAADKEAGKRIAARITVGSRAERQNSFRLISHTFLFLSIAILLQFDIVFDEVNYIPDTLSAIFFFLSALCLNRLIGKQIPLLLTTVGYGVASVAYYTTNALFYEDYTDAMISMYQEAADAHTRLLIVSGITSLIFIVMLILFALTLRQIIERYIGLVNGGLLYERMTEKMRHATDEEKKVLDHSYSAVEKAAKREMRIKLLICTVIGVIYAATAFLNDLGARYTERVDASSDYTTGYTYLSRFGWLGAVLWLVGIAWFVLAMHFSSRMKEEAEINLIEE